MLELEPFTMNYSGANAHALAGACMMVASPKWREDQGATAEGWVLQWISAPPDQRVLIASNDDAIVAVFHDDEDEPLDQWTGAEGQERTSAPPGAGFGMSSVNKRLNDRFPEGLARDLQVAARCAPPLDLSDRARSG